MAIRFTIDGVSIEADSAADAAAMIRLLGNQSTPAANAARPAAPALPKVTIPLFPRTAAIEPPKGWDPGRVTKTIQAMSGQCQKTLGLLLKEPGPVSTRDIAKHLGMATARGTGSLFVGIRKAAEGNGPDPLVVSPRSGGPDKAAQVTLTAEFRKAAADPSVPYL